jgi:hypothetical protein
LTLSGSIPPATGHDNRDSVSSEPFVESALAVRLAEPMRAARLACKGAVTRATSRVARCRNVKK